MERGNITLIGATTENPSFEVISALLSRTRVFVLKALSDDDIITLVRRAVAREKSNIDEESIRSIAVIANGDARTALNILDLAFNFIGLPDGKLALAQCAIYLAAAPKSNSVYTVYAAVVSEWKTLATIRCRCTFEMPPLVS